MFSRKDVVEDFMDVLERTLDLTLQLAWERAPLDPVRQQLIHDSQGLKLIQLGLKRIAEDLEVKESE